jgi:hypothetical protein
LQTPLGWPHDTAARVRTRTPAKQTRATLEKRDVSGIAVAGLFPLIKLSLRS